LDTKHNCDLGLNGGRGSTQFRFETVKAPGNPGPFTVIDLNYRWRDDRGRPR
jgi:hypothetical protein